MQKRLLCVILLIISIINSINVFAAASTPDVSSPCVVLASSNGQILYERAANDRRQPGSLVKLLTCLVATEKNKKTDVVEIDREYDTTGRTTMNLKVGERIQMEWLIYGAMVANAYDATIAIAEFTGGTEAEFVKMLNEKATDLGCTNTHITNATGEYDEGQYMSAHDAFIITRAVMENANTLTVFKTARIYVPATNMTDKRLLVTNNYLISAAVYGQYYYSNALGGKSGFTNQDGYNLTAYSAIGTRQLIAVVMGAEKTGENIMSFLDCKELFLFGFDNYRQVNVTSTGDIVYEMELKHTKGSDYLVLASENSLYALVQKDDEEPEFKKEFDIVGCDLPIKKGQRIGSVTYTYNDIVIGSVPIVASDSVTPNAVGWLIIFFKKIFENLVLRIIAGALVIFLLADVLIIKPIKRKKREKIRKGWYNE